MSMLLALPDDATLVTPEFAANLERTVAERITLVDDIDTADEWRRQAEALAAYLAGTDAHAFLLGVTRRTEARIGQLLGKAPGRGRSEMTPHAASFHHERRDEFRTLAAAVDAGLLVYDDDAASDDSPWHATRRALLLGFGVRGGAHATDRYARNAAGAHDWAIASDGDAQGDGWKLLLGDFRDRLAELPAGSVNVIVTDPPYPAEYLPLWGDLGREAARLLVRGGVLAARCGHLFLPDVLKTLGEHLDYGWVYAEPLPGSNVRFLGRRIAVAYQPWVAFSNGPWPAGQLEWHPDLLTESPRTKARYVWEQKPTVAAELIATLAAPGQDVLDPFAGSGSYGIAALGVGCRWIGVELDPAGHAQAAERLSRAA